MNSLLFAAEGASTWVSVTRQIQSCTGEVTLDLGELALISVEGVRFSNACGTKA